MAGRLVYKDTVEYVILYLREKLLSEGLTVTMFIDDEIENLEEFVQVEKLTEVDLQPGLRAISISINSWASTFPRSLSISYEVDSWIGELIEWPGQNFIVRTRASSIAEYANDGEEEEITVMNSVYDLIIKAENKP